MPNLSEKEMRQNRLIYLPDVQFCFLSCALISKKNNRPACQKGIWDCLFGMIPKKFKNTLFL
jgi:hypothetical protein